MIFLAAFLSGIVLIIAGNVITYFEEAAKDREFYERWGHERRPKSSTAAPGPRCSRCQRGELDRNGECPYCRFWTMPT